MWWGRGRERLFRGSRGGRLFDILVMVVDGYQSVGAYSRKYSNGEILNRYNGGWELLKQRMNR